MPGAAVAAAAQSYPKHLALGVSAGGHWGQGDPVGRSMATRRAGLGTPTALIEAAGLAGDSCSISGDPKAP